MTWSFSGNENKSKKTVFFNAEMEKKKENRLTLYRSLCSGYRNLLPLQTVEINVDVDVDVKVEGGEWRGGVR